MNNVINGQQGTVFGAKVLGKITAFDLGISTKNKQTGKWESGYLKCKVLNSTISHELTDKTKVEVDGFLTPNEWQGKDGKVHHDICMWCQDLRFKSEPKDDDIEKGFEPINEESEELPFK